MKRLTRVSLKYATVPVVAIAILSSGESHAQEAGTSISLEEIVVTATRREERLQDVPLAVSALSSEQIAASGYKELSDIQYALPGVFFGTTPNDAGFRLRGVGTAGGFSSSSEQNVGTIVDGVVIPIGNPVQSLGDIERIEVLKGPQGTQFGKNASSGIVSVTTRAPSLEEMEGNVFASYGELSERDVHASISVPIGDTVAAALYAFDKEFDGFVDNNVLNKEWGGSQTSGARAKLLWQPNDAFTAYLIGDYSKSKLEGPAQLWTLNRLPATFDAFFNPPFVNLAALGVTPGFDNEVAVEEYDSQSEQENYGGSVELTFSLGGGTLTSITAYRVSESDPSTFAIDGSPLPRFRAQAYGNESNFTSQEIRWTSPSDQAFEYVAGVYLSRLRAGPGEGQSAQLRPNPANPTNPIVSISNGIGSAQTTSESIAGFIDGSLGFTDTLRLIAGLRYTSDDVEASTSSRIDPAFPPGPSSVGFVVPYTPTALKTGATSDDNVSGRLGLEYKPNDDLMFYGTVARGYLGPTVTFSILTATRTDVKSQTVDDVTVGFKTQFLDRRLTLNGNVFYDEYKDLQTSVFNGVEFVTENAGGLETKGLELELAFAASDNIRMNLGYTYADAKFTDYITSCPPSVVIQGTAAVAATCNAPGSVPGTALYQAEGDTLPGAPENTITAGIDFRFDLGSTLALDANLNAYYRDEVANSAGDTLTIHPDYEVVNLGLGLGNADGSWRIGVFARNVFDEHFQSGLLSLPFASTGGVMNWNSRDGRRTVGISAEARF